MFRRRWLRGPWTLWRVARGILRYGTLALIDVFVVAAIYLLAVALRTGGRPEELDVAVPELAIALALGAGIVQVLANILFDVYRRDWSYPAFEDVLAVVKATMLVGVTLVAVEVAAGQRWIPMGAVLSGTSVVLVVETAIRLRPRWADIARAAFGRHSGEERVIVVGAGKLGRLAASDLTHGHRDHHIVCLVDDDQEKLGSYIRGIRVEGTTAELPTLIGRFQPSTVAIALDPAPSSVIRRIVDLCEPSGVRIRVVNWSGLRERDTMALRPIGIEELLERQAIDLDTPEMRESLHGRVVLITGAAGTVGQELARQVRRFGPARLLLLDANESGLHDLMNGLDPTSLGEGILGDIRNARWINHFFDVYRPEVVFHAAAYKNVPILERHPLTAIATNVLGTANVLRAAGDVGVGTLVFTSSDKAVEPSSVLGSTKRLGELLTCACAQASGANYAAVRFGNVLGSSGSAVPLFDDQLDRGGPVTVTHPEATRYFMTAREAAGLVIEAGAIAKPGDVLVLNMGTAVSVDALVRRMIRLRGLRTPDDVAIEYVGLRPGEKLHEQLWFDHETPTGTVHPWIFSVGSPSGAPGLHDLEAALHRIEDALGRQDAQSALDEISRVAMGSGIVRPVSMSPVPEIEAPPDP